MLEASSFGKRRAEETTDPDSETWANNGGKEAAPSFGAGVNS
jgi:hypothetical protein